VLAWLRLIRAGFAVARSGAFGFADPIELPPRAATAARFARMLEPRGLDDGERGRRLCDTLIRLGPSYVKMGQFLATRPDVVGIDAAEALSRLKDEMKPFPREEAKRIVSDNLEAPLETVFASFSEPIAAASIAQVHRATLKDAEEAHTVAVKVLRPGIRGQFVRDLKTFYTAARFLERTAAEARRLRLVAVVDTLQRSVTLEMDLRLEAAALSEMAENTASETDFRVPKVDWELTGRDVLVTEWVEGVSLRDLAALDAAGVDRKRLAVAVVQSFLRHALRDGFFHADMHEGNLFADAEGRLVAVDLGIMGRIGRKERRFLAEILYGFIRRDYRRVAEVHIEAGYVPPIHTAEDFAQALRAIGEPIHGHRAADISMARLLTLLFEVTEIFSMQTRPELILLQKTMVVVEGVARRLDPDFDMWTTAEPVVSQWIERHLGPVGRLEEAGEALAALGRLAGEVPELVVRLERVSEAAERNARHGIRLDPRTVDQIGRAVASHARWRGVALWVLAAAAVAGAIAALAAVF
jgi:ubiquinone biosynthesis protein